MNAASTTSALTVCLVCDKSIVETAVRVSCPPPHQVKVFSRADLVNAQNTLSDHGTAIVHAATEADVLLIDWVFDEAPILNTLCFHVRRRVHTPIFMLCYEGPEAAACIAAGADDALTFPIYLPYLQAKIVSYRRLVQATRVALAVPEETPSADRVQAEVRALGPLRLDLTSHRFFIRDTEVELTPREFALLDFLISNAGILCTRDQILDAVWGINFDTGTNMVDVYMYFLRKKLEAHGLKEMIQTVRGHGYRLEPPDTAAP